MEELLANTVFRKPSNSIYAYIDIRFANTDKENLACTRSASTTRACSADHKEISPLCLTMHALVAKLHFTFCTVHSAASIRGEV